MPDTPQLGTNIGRTVTIKGDIRSEEDLLIDGQVEGTLDLGQHRLVVGPNAQIHARITAREVEVQGVMHGNVEVVERIILRKTSKVVGDLKMAGVVIEDGANFKGSIDIAQPQGAAPPAPAVIAKPPDSPSAG
jgi:cytoskeletal protein CcmA (bactofilin family)